MDPWPIPLRADASPIRLLPSYDEVNIPYTLRLPAYRSSYMRRFHPYPRYYTPTKQYNSDTAADDLLDLSILEAPIPPPVIQPAAPDTEQGIDNVQEQEIQERNEEHVAIADPGMLYANPERQDEEGNQTGTPFLRVDVANAL